MSWPYIILTLSVTRRPSITLTTESQHRGQNQQNTESGSVTFTSPLHGVRDTTECCQGGRDFLMQTFQSCYWPIRGQYSNKWPMRSQGVLSGSGTFHPILVYCTISLHLIILIRSTMMWCCHVQEEDKRRDYNRQLGIFKFKRQKHNSM